LISQRVISLSASATWSMVYSLAFGSGFCLNVNAEGIALFLDRHLHLPAFLVAESDWQITVALDNQAKSN